MKSILNIPINLLKKFQKTDKTINDVKVGEGAIVNLNGKKVAAYKKSDTECLYMSPNCTHMGCEVNWNSTDKSWDCPCHGSKFASDGKVTKGPAKESLPEIKTQ